MRAGEGTFLVQLQNKFIIKPQQLTVITNYAQAENNADMAALSSRVQRVHHLPIQTSRHAESTGPTAAATAADLYFFCKVFNIKI